MEIRTEFPDQVEVKEPPVRWAAPNDHADVSFEDVPYPVVPALTARPIRHVAVKCTGVVWTSDGRVSDRVYVHLHCGGRRDALCDRRNFSAVADCRVCFRIGGPFR